jgi:hypothetical protein
MVYISFELTKEKSLESGNHVAKIIDVKLEKFESDPKEYLCLVWEAHGATMKNKFKLWSLKPKERESSVRRFMQLCTILGINYQGNKQEDQINFDASILLGKYCGIHVKTFRNGEGLEHKFIDSYFDPSTEANSSVPFLNDELGF